LADDIHHSTIFEQIADLIPDVPVLRHGGCVRSWSEFDRRAARLAGGLLEAGIARDSKVAIYAYNCNEWIEAVHAALKVRAVPVNVNYRYLDDELVYLLLDSDAEAVVFHSSFADRIERIRHRLPGVRTLIQVDNEAGAVPLVEGAHDYEQLIASVEPAPRIQRSVDDVLFTYTGGTTGLPKGVITPLGLMSRSMLVFARSGLGIENWPADDYTPAFARALSDRGESPVLTPLCPLMHSAGLIMGSLPTLAAGGCVVTTTTRAFDPAEALETIETAGATALVIAGDAIARPLLREMRRAANGGRAYDLGSVRSIMSAAVAWSAEVKCGFLELMPDLTIQDACGSTEGGIGQRMMRSGDPATTNSFDPVPGLRVLKPDGSEVLPGSGEPGRIATPSIATGYYKDPERTRTVFRRIDGRLFAMAGDLALREPDGSIILLGRGSSVINTGGEKVHPEEVEEAVKTFPGVADCIVVGTPHERFGSEVAAVVSMFNETEATGIEIRDHVRERLAGYKVPRVVVFVPQVPRHSNGKPNISRAVELVLTDSGAVSAGPYIEHSKQG
jgi:acyl-CoA synthetase (AMP-forming)/AMP-acid ligase II